MKEGKKVRKMCCCEGYYDGCCTRQFLCDDRECFLTPDCEGVVIQRSCDC